MTVAKCLPWSLFPPHVLAALILNILHTISLTQSTHSKQHVNPFETLLFLYQEQSDGHHDIIVYIIENF